MILAIPSSYRGIIHTLASRQDDEVIAITESVFACAVLLSSRQHHENREGAIIFQHTRTLDCEGIVSKRLCSPYRGGRSAHWVKVKNRAAPAVMREVEEDWGARRRGRRRRFPSPRRVNEDAACFIGVTPAATLVYVYFEDEPGRRSAAKLLRRDEARRLPPTSPSCRHCRAAPKNRDIFRSQSTWEARRRLPAQRPT
jgi:hypothetical protein